MKAYPDASLVVSAFTNERHSEQARAWFDQLSAAFVTSKWCETEIVSALAIKVRTNTLDIANHPSTLSAIRLMLKASATVAPVQGDHFDRAAAFIETCNRPLRGGDALHLAIAADAGAILWTLDKPMAAAGQALGLDVRLLA